MFIRKKLCDLGEFNLINLIRKTTKLKDKRVLVGIGDDCAVIKEDAEKILLATTDMLVEGVHFTTNFSPYLIGKKSIIVNISDIVATGGFPKYALVSVGFPKTVKLDFVTGIYRGIKDVCNEFNIDIVGGDTVYSEKTIINIALIGEIEKGRYLLRSGAKVGDYVLVTGFLGEGISHLLDKKIYIPKIRLDFVKELVRYNLVHSMIDISDGLSSEINHIANESNVGAEIFEKCIPISNYTFRIAKTYKRNPYELALNGGEDYELLFTVGPEKLFDILRIAKNKTKVSILGRIVLRKFKVTLITGNYERRMLYSEGYDQFKSK
jgi:thiamine-monophosphate kinase